MALTYICSPYRGETEDETMKHVAYAAHLAKEVYKAGDTPVMKHVVLNVVLNNECEPGSEKAKEIGINLLKQCRRMIVGLLYGISESMRGEILTAVDAGISILWIDARPEDITPIREYEYQLERREEPSQTVVPGQMNIYEYPEYAPEAKG